MYIFTRGCFKIAVTPLDAGTGSATPEPIQWKSDFSILSDQHGSFFNFRRISSGDIYMLLTKMELDG
jgi:hypothetical protein